MPTSKREREDAIQQLHVFVGKNEGLDALNTVLDEYRRMENQLHWHNDSDRGGDKMGLRATIVLDDSRNIRWLQQFTGMLQGMTGVLYWHNLAKNEVTVVVGPPHTLRDAPPGSHEWARGYMVAKHVRAIEAYCDYEQANWQKIEFSNQHSFRLLREYKEKITT